MLAAAALLAIPLSAAGQAPAVRGLSREEVEDLREGRGMGLARAAELNDYPGPLHLLDAADTGALALTAAQREAVERLFAQMSEAARRLGAEILIAEAELEADFRRHQVGPGRLDARLGRLASLRAELRGVHLQAHVGTRALLTEAQLARYREIRGYAKPTPRPGHPHGAGHP
jgi:hypothetical protein